MPRLGPYTLLEQVGRGGMGEVHIARRDGASSLCVLKQLRERAEGEHLFRLKREAHVLSQLSHPNIGRLIDAGVENGTFYLALELIPGHTLRRILTRLEEQQRTFPPEIAIQVVLEILDGLAYAHDQKDPEGRPLELVHRDLSPNNVMLGYDGRTRIIDFGIASGKVDDFRTVPGTILGTMRYISPEQALSKPVDKRSDLYTLGTLLYEMLTGVPVVEKGAQREILDAVLRKHPEPFSRIAPELPASLWPVVAKALEKRAQDRFDSAHSFKAALLEASRGLVLPSHERIGEFLTDIFPEDTKRSIAPDENTHSAESAGETDHSESSSTFREDQPTIVDPSFRNKKPPPPIVSVRVKRRPPIGLVAIAAASAMTALGLVLFEIRPTAPPLKPAIAPKVVPIREPQDSLRDKLSALRKDPYNADLMRELHDEILSRSAVLSARARHELRASLDAAFQARDVDAIEEVVALLERKLSE